MLYPFSRLCRPARSPASCGPARRRKRGFNLIESAIVLGVVGLVIGGIWVAAATMYENYKVGKTIEGVLTISRNIQNAIKLRDTAAIAHSTNIIDAVRDGEWCPKDWVYANDVKHPFGGDVGVRVLHLAGPTRFRLELHDVPASACITLINRISVIGENANRSGNAAAGKERSGLGYVTVTNSAMSVNHIDTTSFPISISTAKPACEISGMIVMFGFGFIN